VSNKTEERQITSRTDGSNHRVAEALVGDDTGCILLTLWDNMIDEVAANDKIKIENGYVSLFKGSMRLNVGRYGKISKVEVDLPDVNTQNNLSERVIERKFGEERGDRFGKRRFRRY
jgi:replication factor A1